MRLDLLLKHLCLVKTRTQGRRGCESGRVKLNGGMAKPSAEARTGDIIEIRYPDRVIVLELLEIPQRQISRRERLEFIRIVRETPLNRDDGGWNG